MLGMTREAAAGDDDPSADVAAAMNTRAAHGCMKQAYNKLPKPVDLEAVHALCVCVNDAVTSSFTPAQMDANDQFATEHGKVDSVVVNRLREQPSMQAAPKMAACLKAQPELARQLQAPGPLSSANH